MRSVERWEAGGAIGRQLNRALNDALCKAPESARAEFEVLELVAGLRKFSSARVRQRRLRWTTWSAPGARRVQARVPLGTRFARRI
ncbi:MAG: hypothetical protein ACRDYA_19670 [Egibacteraceae bacterium]